MKTAATKIAHYNNRMTSSQIDPVLSAVNATAKANYAAHAIEYTPLLASVHNYLSTQGVPPESFFNYDGFAGEVFHVSKTCAGPAAVAAVVQFQIKWLLYGCTAPHMKAIALIFSITIP